MRFYVKNDKGELVKAKTSQVLDPKVKLFTESGEELARAGNDAPDGDLQKISGIVDTLSTKVNDLATKRADDDKQIKDLQKKNDDLQTKLNAYQDNKGRGLILPDGDGSHPATHGEGDQEVWKFISSQYDLRMQAQGLTDKRVHPFHVLEDKEVHTPDGRTYNPKNEFIKFFCLIAAASNREPYPEKLEALRLLRKIYGEVRNARTKTDIGDTGNAFPIPDIVEAEILAFARERSVILQYARVWPMVSEKQSFPAETSGATVYWGNTTEEGNPTISEVELDAEELSAYCTVKNTTLADSRSDVVGWIGETLSEAAGLELDNKSFNGAGSDSPFICSGLLSAACGYSVVMGAGSTAFSNITASLLSEMIAKLDGLKKEGARFWYNGAVHHYIRVLQDTNGRPIFYDGHYGAPTPPQVMGYPYTEVIKAPSTSAANTAFVVFGNMRYFAVGRRLETAALDIDPYGDWLTNRTRYKLYHRWALNMAQSKGFVRLLTHS